MKFIDFFAGIGGFRLGMEMAGHECVGHCEIDKFANKSYIAMHNPREDEWYANDIRRVRPEDLSEAEVYCFGFPCQTFSIAGKRRGFEDTRGTLFFEVMRLAKERKPKILFAENVAGLLNHEQGKTFGIIIRTMDELGYDVEWQVCNSKNFGVPQNRERVFIIGHFRGRGSRKVFPIPRTDEKNCIKQVGNYLPTATRINPNQGRIYSPKRIAPCLNKMEGGGREPCVALPTKENQCFTLTGQDRHGVMIKEATKKGYVEAYEGDSINLAMPNSKTRRGRVGKGIANTLDTSCNQGILWNCKIRKLTPRECFRLQGFPDEYFERAAAVNNDSQLYKQAGNSVTVNVIYEIAKLL